VVGEACGDAEGVTHRPIPLRWSRYASSESAGPRRAAGWRGRAGLEGGADGARTSIRPIETTIVVAGSWRGRASTETDDGSIWNDAPAGRRETTAGSPARPALTDGSTGHPALPARARSTGRAASADDADWPASPKIRDIVDPVFSPKLAEVVG